MNGLDIKSNLEVELAFKNYQQPVRSKILILKELIIETTKEIDSLNMLKETLKWENQAI